MPGIVGIVSAAPPEHCRRTVRAMLSALARREGDPSGEASLPEAHLYVGWTAHPDSFAARMSRAAATPHLQLAFAGECLANDVAIEPPLLELYQQRGATFVGGLNGLFSGVLLDAHAGEALLFNDRYGCERLYVREHGEGFAFASEAKALLAIDAEARALDADGMAELFTFGGISSGRSPFRGVSLLPSGSLWTIGRGGTIRKSLYFDPGDGAPRRALPAADFGEEFAATFRRILPRYVAGPRPIGISLTGGLDTRMIMACLPADVRPVCYTYAGPSGETMDARLGRQVAALCGLDHHVLRLDRGFFDDFGSHLDRAVRDSDGHAGATLAHEGYLSDQAAALAPVRLTGNYGGEVFREVSTYKPMALAPSLFAGDFLPVLQAARARQRSQPLGARWGAFYEAPLHLHGVRAVARSVLTFRTPFLDNDLVDLALAAPQDPRAATRAALRVVHEGWPDLAALPTDGGLRWPGHGLAHAARRLAAKVSFKLDYLEAEGSRPALAPLIQTMSKAMTASGLHAPHRFLAYRDWFRRELSTYVGDQLTSRRACEHPYLDRQGVAEVLSDHLSGKRNRLPEINAVLSLVSIDRTLLMPPDQQARHFSHR